MVFGNGSDGGEERPLGGEQGWLRGGGRNGGRREAWGIPSTAKSVSFCVWWGVGNLRAISLRRRWTSTPCSCFRRTAGRGDLGRSQGGPSLRLRPPGSCGITNTRGHRGQDPLFKRVTPIDVYASLRPTQATHPPVRPRRTLLAPFVMYEGACRVHVQSRVLWSW
jgi:hypothetical protein